MKNEETILDSPNNAESKQNETTNAIQPDAEVKKGIGLGEKAAYATGGTVIGTGMTLGGQAMAANISSKSEDESEKDSDEGQVAATVASESNGVESEDIQATTAATTSGEQHAAPEPEEAIVATATGVRVAQVDDNVSFSQAFADARAQVGPGGVFEWHGRAYSTYYKDEWDDMSPAERAEFQASIDYNDVISDQSMAQHHNDMAQNNLHHSTPVEPEAQPDPNQDVDVHVLEVGQIDIDGDGANENAALLNINGHEVVVVDMDGDNVADVAICDANGNYQIDEGEAANISEAHLQMPTAADVDVNMMQADAGPDYMNDADVGLYEA